MAIRKIQERKNIFSKIFYNTLICEEARLWAEKINQSKENSSYNFLDLLNIEFVESMSDADRKKYTEELMVLDKNGNFISKANWLLVMKASLFHAAVQVIIVDPKIKKILLQKRAYTVTDAEKWDISASGHLPAHCMLPRDRILQAIEEAHEEMGISKKLFSMRDIKVLNFYYYEKKVGGRLKKTFFFPIVAHFSANELLIVPNQKEVSDWKWYSLEEISLLNPEELAHGLSGLIEKKILNTLL